MLYPMTFKPILKKIIWGGSDICPFKGITPVQEGIGESWELSHVEGNYSVVDNGALEGKTLDELIRTYGKQLLGEKVVEQFGSIFPLLIKFIDARDNLSIQVHPDDELAKKRHNSFGKTEMWYVVDCDEGATLLYGFKHEITKEERENLVKIIKNLPVHISGTRGYNEAIITKGGISIKEINPKTMESKIMPNIYFVGEVLDLDAMTGGYNLQIAWSTGYLAGNSIY